MTAVVPAADVVKARTFVGAFTEMREQHQFNRVQHFEPQYPAVKGPPKAKELQKERAPNGALWQELHQILVKQPSTLLVRTRITDEVNNVHPGEVVTIPPAKSRLLRWTELPDPPSSRTPPFIIQRRILEISDGRMEQILAEDGFKCVIGARASQRVPGAADSFLTSILLQDQIELGRRVVPLVAQRGGIRPDPYLCAFVGTQSAPFAAGSPPSFDGALGEGFLAPVCPHPRRLNARTHPTGSDPTLAHTGAARRSL